MATLLLDLDGTLLNVRARHYAVYSTLAREYGFPVLDESLYWRRRRAGRSAAALVPQQGRDAFRCGWLRLIEDADMLALDTLFPGAIGALEALLQKHRLVLLTLRHDNIALEQQLKNLGLREWFDCVLASGDARAEKTELWTSELRTGDEIVVGDGETDIDLAAEIGARCVSVTYGLRSKGFLRRRGATRLAASIRQAAGAIDGR